MQPAIGVVLFYLLDFRRLCCHKAGFLPHPFAHTSPLRHYFFTFRNLERLVMDYSAGDTPNPDRWVMTLDNLMEPNRVK